MAARKPNRRHDGPALCGAKKKQGGGTCAQVAGWGTPNTSGPCKLHGGSTRNHKVAADRERARAACELFNLDLAHRDPGEVLLDELIRARRAMAWHEREIALAMEAGDDELRQRRYEGWQSERSIAMRVSVEAVRLGLAQRALDMQEDVARQVVGVLTEYARLLGLDPSSPKVRGAARQALQLVAGEAA